MEVANVIAQSERSQTGNQHLYTSDQVVQAVRQWQPQRYRAQRNQNQTRRNPKKNQNQNRACYGCGSATKIQSGLLGTQLAIIAKRKAISRSFV